MAKKRILGVIGLGHVGAHVAYALAVQGIADELVLVDKNARKLASEIQDLRDAAAYLPHRVVFRSGEFSDLGEHGNRQFAPWSAVSFRGMPLDAWAKKDDRFRFDREALQKESIGGGWVTFSGKYCTEYGIATTAARMAHIVLHDEKAIMPASAELCGEYGESGLFAGVPCVLGANGVERIVELPLTAEEQAQFHACCSGIRDNMKHWNSIRNIR